MATPCPQGTQRTLGGCYEPCRPGYTAFGEVCQKPCKEGYLPDGDRCTRPAEEVRKVVQGRIASGVPFLAPCPPGLRDTGTTCWIDSYGRGDKGVRPTLAPCPPGMRDDGTSCYADPVGRGGGEKPSLTPCPDGMNDRLGACWADTYGRGTGRYVGLRGNCYNNEDKSVDRCYPKCKAGFKAAGCCLCDPHGGPGIKVHLEQREVCRGDQDKVGRLCYPKCRAGFRAVGCCLCEPEGGSGIKVTVGERYRCPDGMELWGAMCYPKCRPGFKAVGCCVCEPEGGPKEKLSMEDRKRCPADQSLIDGLCYPACPATHRAAGCCSCVQVSCLAGYTDTGKTCRRNEDSHPRDQYVRVNKAEDPDWAPFAKGIVSVAGPGADKATTMRAQMEEDLFLLENRVHVHPGLAEDVRQRLQAVLRMWRAMPVALRAAVVILLLLAPFVGAWLAVSLVKSPLPLARLSVGVAVLLALVLLMAWGVSGFAASPWMVMRAGMLGVV